MELETNIVYCGDCLKELEQIPSDCIDLIYIDPPFSSNRDYVAFWEEQEKRHFEDKFENVTAYIDYMRPRVEELYRVLKPTGSFYYHCDWHASHYIRRLLDAIFDYSNFRNEIIWHYRKWSTGKAQFQRNHDVILFYSKSASPERVFNQLYMERAESTLRRFGIAEIKSGYDVEGHRVPSQITDEVSKGARQDDVWEIGRVPPIKQLFPTQKPEPLLERIIKASSREGDIVLDAFCGCGTTLMVAQRERRKWIGIDISPTACRVMAKRLQDNYGIKEGVDFRVRDLPKTVEELRQYPPFEFQNWAVNALGGIPSKIKVRDGGIDGKVYPVEIKKGKVEGIDLFGDIDRYIPVQVKRTDQVGRPDIENFEVAMERDKRDKGIFVGFNFSRDAEKEIRRVKREKGLEIETVLVSEILEKQLNGWLK